MAYTSPDSPLTSNFSSLNLHNSSNTPRGSNLLNDDSLLADESILLGDSQEDTLDLTATQSSSQDHSVPRNGVGSSATAGGTGIVFGGSMGTRLIDEKREEMLRNHVSNSTVPVVEAPNIAVEEEEVEYDEEGLKAAGLNEEERKRYFELKEERDGLRGMNKVLNLMLGSVKAMEDKMNIFASNTTTTHELLDLYSRLCSQAEHTQNLLLDPQFHGASADAAMLHAREVELERQRIEEQERIEREEARKEELRLAREQQVKTRGAERGTGRGRGVTRGSTASSSVRGSGVGRGASSSFGSTTSGIGRGGPTSSSSTRGTGTVTGVRGVRGLRSKVVTRGRGVV